MDTPSAEGLPGTSSDELSHTKSGTPTGALRPRRPARLLLVLILLLPAGWLTLPSAWRETCRREAYLPQLEAEDRNTPFDGRLLALLGGEYAQAGEYSASADTLRRAIATGEQDPLVWLNLAAATAASGDPVQATTAISLGLQAHPTDPLLLSARQRAQSLGHDASPAQLAGAISPEGPDLLVARHTSGSFLNRVASWWGRLRPDSAGFRTREEWARENPNDASVKYHWGLALFRSRRYMEAVDVLKQTVASDPQFAPAHLALGDALTAAGLTGDGVVEYLDALKVRPNWTPALLGAGKGYLATGITTLSIECYVRATTADPNSADAWIGLGMAYRRTGVDHDKAITAFRNAERLAPARTDYFVDYADALRQAAQWPAAEAILARRLKAAPDDPLAHYTPGHDHAYQQPDSGAAGGCGDANAGGAAPLTARLPGEPPTGADPSDERAGAGGDRTVDRNAADQSEQPERDGCTCARLPAYRQNRPRRHDFKAGGPAVPDSTTVADARGRVCTAGHESRVP